MKLELVRGKISLTIDGFNFLLNPMFAVNGRLMRLKATGIEDNTVFFSDKRCCLKFFEENGVVLLEAECSDGYTGDGVIVEIEMEFKGIDSYLIYHFTYDVDNSMLDEENILIYPQLKDVDEKTYCPWSYPMHIDIDRIPENIKISQILMYSNAKYCFLLPLSSRGARGYITRRNGKTSLILNSYREGGWIRAEICSIAVDKNPYKAVYRAYKVFLKRIGRDMVLRENKRFPDLFKYIGWCSWNACWRRVSEEKVLKIVDSILDKGINLKYVIIDDGWQNEEERMIKSLKPVEERFPRGFKYLVSELKKRGIRYVGLWHTLNIHWGGIYPESSLAKEYREYLMKSYKGLIPDPEKSFSLFNKLYSYLRLQGFDFVKVDNQSFVTAGYAGKIAVEYASQQLHKGLEAAAYLNNLKILNCMAQQPENVFNWYRSSVSRNCIDYCVPHNKYRDKLHIYFNTYNSIWMSQIVWPDWDMFQSHDPWSLQQAVARAISGGPIYITDEYGKTSAEIIKPLILNDGRILRPDIPAMPTLDSLFKDPYNERYPLKIYSHIDVEGFNRYGVLAVFNIYRRDEVIEGEISPIDTNVSGKTFLIYEYFSKKYWILDLNERINVKLNPMDVKLFIIAPLNGWMVPLGLENKYIMPATIKRTYIFDDEAIVALHEPGIFLLYTEKDISVDGGKIVERNGLMRIKCSNNVIRISN